MWKFIISWFKKDHAKASKKILSAFDNIKVDLEKLNEQMHKRTSVNLLKMAELSAHNDILAAVTITNSNVINNLNNLTGGAQTTIVFKK